MAQTNYSGDVSTANTRLQNSVDQANAYAQNHANQLYDQYRATTQSSYERYIGAEAEALSYLNNAIESQNATLANATSNASEAFTSYIAMAQTTAANLLANASSAFDSTMTNANSVYDSAIAAAGNDEVAIGAAVNILLSSVETAYDSGNSTSASASSMANQLFDGAITNLETTITSAINSYASAIDTATSSYIIQELNAWNAHFANKAGAWSEYQLKRADIPVEQERQITEAVAQYGIDIAAANNRYTSDETGAWGNYAGSLAQGEASQSRFASPPDMGSMPAVVIGTIPTLGINVDYVRSSPNPTTVNTVFNIDPNAPPPTATTLEYIEGRDRGQIVFLASPDSITQSTARTIATGDLAQIRNLIAIAAESGGLPAADVAALQAAAARIAAAAALAAARQAAITAAQQAVLKTLQNTPVGSPAFNGARGSIMRAFFDHGFTPVANAFTTAVMRNYIAIARAINVTYATAMAAATDPAKIAELQSKIAFQLDRITQITEWFTANGIVPSCQRSEPK